MNHAVTRAQRRRWTSARRTSDRRSRQHGASCWRVAALPSAKSHASFTAIQRLGSSRSCLGENFDETGRTHNQFARPRFRSRRFGMLALLLPNALSFELSLVRSRSIAQASHSPSSLIVMEALLRGVPCVSSDWGGLPEANPNPRCRARAELCYDHARGVLHHGLDNDGLAALLGPDPQLPTEEERAAAIDRSALPAKVRQHGEVVVSSLTAKLTPQARAHAAAGGEATPDRTRFDLQVVMRGDLLVQTRAVLLHPVGAFDLQHPLGADEPIRRPR